ncbi:hypothetical protein P171DRAFT_389310 [Karstenula rhodostoma CBS 690.94]|uniref:Rhodopsin domain-containing protein n=1 Tax=Karstenula rhodostoma CBS 690.94 TaxID=1392251 RepID=A0A9P4PKG4_9PLEO|nr:hypothetical protein P171DRAFT_389310 [Karstenula rhodostoma CBS 690.94]
MAPLYAQSLLRRVEQQKTGDSNATLAVSGLVIALAVVSVGLRFYTRIFTKSGLKADDWSIFSAVLFTLATAVVTLVANSVAPNGLWVSENTDTSYVYTSHDVLYLKLAFATSILYFTIAGTTKLAILLMYNRIFNVSNAFRAQLYLAIFLVVGWWLGCTVASFTNCIPLKWSWINSFADPRYCFDYNLFWMASGSCEIVLDVIILAMPVSVVVRMKMSWRRKGLVLGIFALGAFTIITGLVRVVLGFKKNSRVPSYSNTEVWTTVHAGMSIVCASLPIFRPLIRRIGQSALMSRLSSALSIRKGTGIGRSASEKKHSPSSSADHSIASFVHNERVAPAFVPTSFITRPEPAFVEPTFVQLPTICVEERHNSLTAQWAGFLEESDERGKIRTSVACEEV